ncbi:hypothetical protein Hanom_Chr01g00018301 [Helianthus anomalus]
MGSCLSLIGPTILLFYKYFKITFSSCNSVSLPLVQIGGEQYLLEHPVYYFISTLKLRFCLPLKIRFCLNFKIHLPFCPELKNMISRSVKKIRFYP